MRQQILLVALLIPAGLVACSSAPPEKPEEAAAREAKVAKARGEVLEFKTQGLAWIEYAGSPPVTMNDLRLFDVEIPMPPPPTDPWGRRYRCEAGEAHPDGFLIWSLGEDPDDPSDDIRSDEL